MKRGAKILATASLIILVAAGVMISYNDPNAKLERAIRDCPAYATNQALYMSRSGANWIRASQITAMVAGNAPGAGTLPGRGGSAGPPPRINYIDDYLFDRMEADDVPSAALCTDEEFVRRVYLDLTGRVPSSDDVRQFLASSDPNKRINKIDELIGTPEFVDRWTMFYGDLFKNTYGGQGGPQALYYGRTAYYYYIKDFIQTNKSLADVAADLLAVPLAPNPPVNSWENGPVNYFARAWEMMVNQYDVIDNTVAETTRIFLGTPALCVSCHNGIGHLEQVNLYLSRKYRWDLWGLSAYFSGVRFQRVREGSQPNTFSFNFREQATEGYDIESQPAQGGIRPRRITPPDGITVRQPNYFFTGAEPKGTQWRSDFVNSLISDPQFSRAAVNYLWKELFGMGIVDPPDTFDLARLNPKNPPPDPWTIQPTHPELLNRLAEDFAEHGYDIRYMIRLMMTSSAYGLSARYEAPWEGRYAQYFARHFAKRMTAEQLADSIYKSTGIPGNFVIDDLGPIQWTMQFPDTTEPRGGGGENVYTRAFLNSFFRGDRNTTTRTREGSTLQALALMNNNLLHNRIRVGQGGIVDDLIESGMTTDQIIDELCLSTISRYPTSEERTKAQQMINVDRSTGTEDLLLILWNKLDSIFY